MGYQEAKSCLPAVHLNHEKATTVAESRKEELPDV